MYGVPVVYYSIFWYHRHISSESSLHYENLCAYGVTTSHFSFSTSLFFVFFFLLTFIIEWPFWRSTSDSNSSMHSTHTLILCFCPQGMTLASMHEHSALSLSVGNIIVNCSLNLSSLLFAFIRCWSLEGYHYIMTLQFQVFTDRPYLPVHFDKPYLSVHFDSLLRAHNKCFYYDFAHTHET